MVLHLACNLKSNMGFIPKTDIKKIFSMLYMIVLSRKLLWGWGKGAGGL